MRKVVFVLQTLVFLLGLGGPANARLMVIWDFGPSSAYYTLVPSKENVAGIPTLQPSGGYYDNNGKDGVAYIDAEGDNHIAGQAVAWDDVSITGPDDAQWIMTIDTTCWQDMTIRWDYLSDATGSNQGPTSFDFWYKIGVAGSWIRILDDEAIIRDDMWHEFRYDLSDISSIENQTYVQFRVDDLDENDLNGDYKFDNLELTGVPEPATILLLGLGGLSLLRRRGG